MFGQNAVASARPFITGYTLNSAWFTIQGEGPWAGLTAIFVRLTGCNLRCVFCDTEFEKGDKLELGELARTITSLAEEHNCPRIVFTGGEPMLYALPELIMTLREMSHDRHVFQIETAGTVWPKGMETALDQVIIVTSPKTPKVHPMIAEHTYAWKYIIKAGEVSAEDGLPNRSTQKAGEFCLLYRPAQSYAKIYVQPCDEGSIELNRLNIAEAVNSALTFKHRLSIQLHKIAGVD